MNTRTFLWTGITVLFFLLASGPVSAAPLTCLAGGPQPSAEDSDGDGIPDAEDRLPSDPSNACVDFDGDDLNDLREYLFGTDPANGDTDGDRLPDGWEVRAGMDPLDPNDALLDSDGDGVANGFEVHFGTQALDAASVPDLTSPTAAGRYVTYYTDEHPGLGTSVIDGILDLRPDGTASFYNNSNLDYDGDGGELTGSWDALGPGFEVVFDPGQVVSRSATSRIDPDTGFFVQYEVIRYLVRRVILRRPSSDGGETWVGLEETREEVPALSEVSTSQRFLKLLGTPTAALTPMTFAAETVYAMPCLGAETAVGPKNRFGSSLWEDVDTYACRLQFGPTGEAGTNLDSLTQFTPVGVTPDGGFVIEDTVDNWQGTYYAIGDFGNVQSVAVLFEQDGKKWAWGDHVTARTESAWPAPAADRFQYYDWDFFGFGGFGFDFRADGTAYTSSYNDTLGDWSDSYRGSWYLDDGNLVLERYLGAISGRIATDPTRCNAEPCLVYDRRTMMPESLSSGRLLFIHKWEFFEDPQDTDGDGILDSSNLTRVDQGLRGFVRTPPDLDLDGFVDAIDLDDDGDGLPDAWEKDYFASGFGSLYQRTGEQDPDGDGYTNLEEYERGTDPLMPDSEAVRTAFLALLRRGAPGGTLEAAVSYSGSPLNPNQLITFDVLSGQTLGSYQIPETSRDVRAMTTLADLTAGGLDEVALVGVDDTPDRNKAFVRAAEDGSFVRNVNYLDSAWLAQDAAGLPDLSGDGNPDLAVLGTNVSTGEIAVQIRDAVTGGFVKNAFFLNPTWTARQLLVLDNFDANPGEEVGVLATNEAGQIVVMVKDAKTNSFAKNVFFLNANWEPVQALEVYEFNGIRVPWIGLLAQNKVSGQIVFMIKDAPTNQFLVNVFPLGSGWKPLKAALLPDENGNGLELAVLGTNKSTGKLIVQVRDSSNGEFLRNLEILGSNWNALDMIALPDIGGGVPGLSVFATRKADGVPVIQTINAITGEGVSNMFIN